MKAKPKVTRPKRRPKTKRRDQLSSLLAAGLTLHDLADEIQIHRNAIIGGLHEFIAVEAPRDQVVGYLTRELDGLDSLGARVASVGESITEATRALYRSRT